jgi:hypothetical protein
MNFWHDTKSLLCSSELGLPYGNLRRSGSALNALLTRSLVMILSLLGWGCGSSGSSDLPGRVVCLRIVPGGPYTRVVDVVVSDAEASVRLCCPSQTAECMNTEATVSTCGVGPWNVVVGSNASWGLAVVARVRHEDVRTPLIESSKEVVVSSELAGTCAAGDWQIVVL